MQQLGIQLTHGDVVDLACVGTQLRLLEPKVLSACAKGRSWPLALELIDQMQWRRILPDTVSNLAEVASFLLAGVGDDLWRPC